MIWSKNSGLGDSGKRNFFIFSGALVGILILVTGGYLTWQKYFSEGARQLASFNDYQERMKEAYKNDTYGGATPEETLKLFVEALKKGDVDLASKYFVLDDNTNSKDYLTRKKWEVALNRAKAEGGLQELINIVSKAKFDSKSDIFNTASYVVYDKNRILIADISLVLNKISKAWKIESL